MISTPAFMRRLLGLLLFAMLSAPVVSIAAQSETSSSVRGTVLSTDGVPVADALVKLETSDSLISRARTLDNGNFTLPRLAPGTYTLTVQRLGYVNDRRQLKVERGVNRISAELVPLPAGVAVAAASAGQMALTGIVGDFAQMEPLGGATITRMGGGEPVQTNQNGQFVLPLDEPGVGALRVEREGFESQLVSYRVSENARVEVHVLLDSGRVDPRLGWIWRDLDQRSKWQTARTVRVPRSEISGAETSNLLVALERTPTLQTSGIVISRASCLFVNGQPRPGFPIDAIRAEQVEYVEAYPVRTDLSRTLSSRWPPNGSCGAPGGDLTVQRAIDTGQGARFVAVWLR